MIPLLSCNEATTSQSSVAPASVELESPLSPCLQDETDDYICFPEKTVTQKVTIDFLGQAYAECPITTRYTMRECHLNTTVPSGIRLYQFYDFGFAIPEHDSRCDALWNYLNGLPPEEKQNVLDQIYKSVREAGVDSIMYKKVQTIQHYCNDNNDFVLRGALIEATCYYRCEELIAIETHPDFPGPGLKSPDKSQTRDGDGEQGLYRYYKHYPCGDGCCMNVADYCGISCNDPWHPNKMCGYKRRHYKTETWGDCLNQKPRPAGACPPPPTNQDCTQECAPFQWWKHN